MKTIPLIYLVPQFQKQAADAQPQIGFMDALKVLKAQVTGGQPNPEQLADLQQSRAMQYALASLLGGTALGAAGGAGVQALRRAGEPNPKKKPSLLKGMLVGGLLGGGAGAALVPPAVYLGARAAWNETPNGQLRPVSVGEALQGNIP